MKGNRCRDLAFQVHRHQLVGCLTCQNRYRHRSLRGGFTRSASFVRMPRYVHHGDLKRSSLNAVNCDEAFLKLLQQFGNLTCNGDSLTVLGLFVNCLHTRSREFRSLHLMWLMTERGVALVAGVLLKRLREQSLN
jgi:hypothetical protein